jgi:hypothetical protein
MLNLIGTDSKTEIHQLLKWRNFTVYSMRKFIVDSEADSNGREFQTTLFH